MTKDGVKMMKRGSKKGNKTIRKPTFFEAISTVLVLVVLFVIGYGRMHLQTEPLLIAAAIYAAFIAKRVGLSWNDMERAISDKIGKSIPAILILLAVGLMIGAWIYAGIIPMMIFYGMKLISPKFIIAASFLICAITSTVTGTSWGSAGTAGVALMGIATGLGAPLPMVAGAVAAGSLFGDKLSPLSDTTNLAAIVAECDVYEHIKSMLYTTIPAALISIIIYIILGFNVSGEVVAPEKAQVLLNTLDTMYNWSMLLIIPIAIVLYGSATRKSTVATMLLSSSVAITLGILIQGFSFEKAMITLVHGFNVNMVNVSGFDPSSASWEVTRIVNSGGIISMMETVLFIIIAYCFAAIAEESKSLEVIVHAILRKVKTVGGLITSTAASTIVMNAIGGQSYISFLITGELFRDAYKERGLHTSVLSRTLEDAGTMVLGIIPWSSCGIYFAKMLGVPVIQYLPYAFLCYLCTVFAIIYGYTGFGIIKAKDNIEMSA